MMYLLAALLWTELIAFDNTLDDFGVKEYLSRFPERPSAVSLLLVDPEVVNAHSGIEADYPLPVSCSSYCARPWNEERKRQQWSAWQLRGLVAELRRQGLAVAPSFFDFVLSQKSGHYVRNQATPPKHLWIDEHQELEVKIAAGVRTRTLSPLSRFSDGTPYADFFIAQLLRFMDDFGFTFYHACDGWGHPRYSLAELKDAPSAADRAREHAAFIRALADSLHRTGRWLALNTTWMLDPLNALEKYGVDYRLLDRAGVDMFVNEASATVFTIEGWNKGEVSKLDRCRAALLLTSAAVTNRLTRLACIKDGMEQYNSLRHAPALMAAELLSLSTLCRRDGFAAPEPFWCLADGISAAEWKLLDRLTKLPPAFGASEGVRLVVNEACERPEGLERLLRAGAVVSTSLTAREALADAKVPLLVLDPARHPESQLAELRKRTVPVVEFGEGASTSLEAAVAAINALSPARPDAGQPDLRLQAYRSQSGSLVVVALNDRDIYLNAALLVKGPVTTAEALTESPSLPIVVEPRPEGQSRLSAKIPPRGAILLEIR